MRSTGLFFSIFLFYTISVFGQAGSCQKSTEGKEFWFGFMEGRNYQVGHYCEVTLSSSYSCNYKIYIGKSVTPSYTGSVLPNIPVKVLVDWKLVEATGSETVQSKAIHLVSDLPVNVYALNWSDSSSEVAMIFPKESLGDEYYAMCYTPHINGNGINTGSGRNSEFMIVASEENTVVNIIPTKVTDKGKPANKAFSIILNKGELYQVQSENLPIPLYPGQGDLTGSYITSDKPIAFFSGSLSTTVPGNATNAWDHLYEQIPPIQTWGRKFIAVPLKTRHEDTYRILASENYTTVRIGNKISVLLNKGQYYEFSLLYTEPSLIESDKPVLLAQYSNSNSVDMLFTGGDGDPFMVIVSAVNQSREKVAFVAYESAKIYSKFFINVVVKDDAIGKIKLDNKTVSFISISGTGYSYAQVSISKGNHYIETTEAGKGFIAYVYGFGGVEAYGYGVGYNLDMVLDLGSNINANGKVLVRCESDPTLTLNAGNAFDKYLWSTGDTTSSIQVTNPGWYKVKASVNNGCELKDSVELQVSNPIIKLGGDTTICNQSTTVLDAGDQLTNYLWSTTQTSQKISISKPGVYSVEAINKFGCKARDTIMISFADKPKLDFSKIETLICGKFTSTLDITADKNVTWLMKSTNPKVKINNLTATVLPADFGTYPMTLTAKDDFSCTTDTAFNLGFYEGFVVNLGNDTTICNPANIKLNAGSLYASYLWSTAETTSSVIVKNNGLYSVKVTDKNGCKTYDEIKVSFTDKPKLDLSKLETLICGPFTTTVNVSADKNVTWLLSSNNPKVKFNGLTASVSPADFGIYPITLTSKDEYSCATNTSFNLGFYKTPRVKFSISEEECYGYNLDAFYEGDADISQAKFTWVFGNDTIMSGIGRNKEKIPLGVNQSLRNLVLTVEQNGCSNQHSISDIRVIPTLNLSVKDTLLCMPNAFEFKAVNTETGVTYDWDFGDGSKGVGTNPQHGYAKPGKYDIQLKVTTDKNCSNTVLMKEMVFAAPIPTVGFTPLPAVCLEKANQSISYLGSGDALDRYIWNITKLDNDEVIQNPKETQGPLIFNLKNKPETNIGLKVISKYGCQSADATVFVKRKPDFSINSSSKAGCTPFEPVFTAKANDPVDQLSYNWNFGDGAYGNGSQIKHIYNMPNQKYDIVLTALSSTTGCTDSLNSLGYILTYPIPTAGFTPLDAECLEKGNNQISYKGTGDQLDTYFWNLSGFDTEEVINNPNKTQGPLVFDLKNKPQTNIRLNVVSKYGCKSDTATVLVKRKPDFSIKSSSNAGCTPFEPLLSGNTADRVDKVNYSWNFGDGTSGSGDQVKHEYSEPNQKYDVILSALSSTTGCTDTIISKEFLWVYPKPKAAFTMDHKIVYNDKPTVNFSSQSIEAEEYYWDFGDKLTSDLKDPSHYYKVPGYRTVLLEVFNQYQCSDTISDRLLVAFDRIFAPTGFSPNAPNVVDREFRLGSEGIATDGYHLTILSRWNDIVFEIRNEFKGWSGIMPNGSLAPAGTYVWILNFSDFLGRSHRQTGTITVVY